MRRIVVLSLGAGGTTLPCRYRAYAGRMTDAALIGRVTAPDLHVMTYNVRRRVPGKRPGSPDRWATRKDLVRRILAEEQPTIVGVQEAIADQAEFVAEAPGRATAGSASGATPRAAESSVRSTTTSSASTSPSGVSVRSRRRRSTTGPGRGAT